MDKWTQRKEELRRDQIERSKLDPKSIARRRRELWAKHGLDDDTIAKRRADLNDRHGLGDRQIAQRLRDIELEVEDILTRERAEESP